MKPLPLGPFLGVNNRLPDFGLLVDPRSGETFLRSASNVDIDNAHKIRRRAATERFVAMTGAHSLYMLTDTTGVLVRASVLYRVTLPTYTETLLKVLASDDPMSYAVFNDTLYMSNGTDRLRLTAGVVNTMSIITPDAPDLTLVAGSLLPGWYQVSISYRTSATATEGEESGISASSNIQIVSGTAGIQVELPGPAEGATHIAVHLSAANGSQPYLATTVPVATATVDLTVLASGHEAPIRFEDPLPAGELFMSNGRLCSFIGNTVYVGIAFRPGYYLPLEGYIPFPADVTMAIENQQGTFIAADKTYWIPGDLGDVQDKIPTVLPYGAVRGTAFTFPDRSMVGWFGLKGVVFGKTSGEVEAVMTENVDVTPPASGRSIVLETGGHRRVVSCGWCVNIENKAATSYLDWDFTSLSGGYGTMADGIYHLVATGAVDAVVGFGKQNFGVENIKYLPTAYLGVDCEELMELRIVVPGGGDYTYPARGRDAEMKIQRVDTGRGLNATWFDIYAMNQYGADFSLASASLAPAASTRRI